MGKKKIYIVTPCYNDFESLIAFLSDIDGELDDHGAYWVCVVVVNDGSVDVLPEGFLQKSEYRNIARVEKIDLIRNMGHQRAITVGLAYVNEHCKDCDCVVVMDCDGEDRCRDIFRMIGEMSDEAVIFAKRRKRSEGLRFRLFYFLYKRFFRFFSGYEMHGGNFSLIPRSVLNRVVNLGEIWNHYHAGILKSKLRIKYIDCDRGSRYKGLSKMNFTSLIIHGFSSVSVFNENVFARLIMLFSAFLAVSGVTILTVLILKFVLHAATPGWATSVIGVTAILCVQFLLIVLSFAFINLGSRNAMAFLPARDYGCYVLGVEKIFGGTGSGKEEKTASAEN